LAVDNPLMPAPIMHALGNGDIATARSSPVVPQFSRSDRGSVKYGIYAVQVL
jgi:hypothetical protein